MVVQGCICVECAHAGAAREWWVCRGGLNSSPVCVGMCGSDRQSVSRRCLVAELGGWGWFGVPAGLLLVNRRERLGVVFAPVRAGVGAEGS